MASKNNFGAYLKEKKFKSLYIKLGFEVKDQTVKFKVFFFSVLEYIKRERGGERKTNTHTKTDRQTDRQGDSVSHMDRQTNRHTNRRRGRG